MASHSSAGQAALVALAVMCCLTIASAGEVPMGGDVFARQEVDHLLKQMEKERLVSFSKKGTLTLADPSAEVTGQLGALGDGALPILGGAFPAASDGVQYGISRFLAGRGDHGQRILARLARDRRVHGRRWIVAGLTGVFTAATVPCFRELALDPEPVVAEAAIYELGQCEDDQGVRILRSLVRSPDRSLARKAAQALTSRKDAAGVNVLLTALPVTRELRARLTLIQSLGSAGAPVAIPTLLRVFVDAARRVSATEGSPNMGWLFQGRTISDSTRGMFEATYASGALSGLVQRAPRPEICQLVDHENPLIRVMAVEILAACGDASAIPTLRQTLQAAAGEPADSPDGSAEQLMVLAAQSLRQIGGPQARAALEEAWRTSAGNAKASISLCLAALDHPGGLKAAVLLAQSGPQQMRIAAVSALGFSRSSMAFNALSALLESSDSDIRLLAASSLSQPGNLAAQRPLQSLLAEGEAVDDPQSLSVAALGLGLAGDDKSIRALERLLVHKNPSVRRAAAVGLYYITGKSHAYVNMWGLEGTFEPTTFHRRLREEKLARLGPR